MSPQAISPPSTPSKTTLLPLLAAGMLVLVSLNLLLAAWSHKLPYHQKLESIRTAHDPNLLVVGNSLLDHHLDEAALNTAAETSGARYAIVNSALGASEPPEQRLLFDYAVEKHPGIHTLVVGIYDFQLTAPDHSSVTDLTGNRMVGIDHRFPAAEVASTYGFGMVERAQLAILRAIPMAAYRANAWKYVELLRRSMASLGMPHVATNSMGRVEDFGALEAGSPQLFDAQAEAFLSQPTHFNASYESIFTQAHNAGMKIVVVIMPMSPAHRESFYVRPLWNQYRQALTTLAGQRGIRIVDASGWMSSQDDFADHLHMTQQAAHDFSARLGTELTAKTN